MKTPKIGDKYYPYFESDYNDPKDMPPAKLTIASINASNLEDNGVKGFWITASDGIGYDCFWSKKLKNWVYALSHETPPNSSMTLLDAISHYAWCVMESTKREGDSVGCNEREAVAARKVLKLILGRKPTTDEYNKFVRSVGGE